MASDENIAEGLLDWINSLHVTDEVRSAEDFSNGAVVWKVLQHIDPERFSGELPEGSDSADVLINRANLKYCYDAVVAFLLSECKQDRALLPTSPDLLQIARSESLIDTVILLKHLPIAAFKGNNKRVYIQDVGNLAATTQEVIMVVLQESMGSEADSSQEADEVLGSDESFQALGSISGDTLDPATGPDSELAQEERLANIIAEKERIQQENFDLQKQLRDLHEKHADLEQNNDKTQDDLKDTRDRLDTLLGGNVHLNTLRASDSKHDNLIAELEGKLSEAESENETLRREHAISLVKAETAQRLQDEHDVMKLENSKLARKAAAADKYKQKLEATQIFEKENRTLQAKVSDLQQQLKASDSSNVASAELRRANQEYQNILSTIEREFKELNDMKKRIEFDNHTLIAQNEESVKQITHYKVAVEDLQGRLQDYEDGKTPTTPKQIANGLALSDYDSQFAQDEAKLSEEFTTVVDDDQNYISELELRAIMAAMQAQARDAGASRRASGIAEDKNLAEKIERGRTTTKQLIQHTQKQTALIAHLRKKLSSTPVSEDADHIAIYSITADPGQQAQGPLRPDRLDEILQENQHLRRENRLMASAWYDQNRRLMNSNVSVSRGRPTPEPKSFLGRQRKVVEDVMIGRP